MDFKTINRVEIDGGIFDCRDELLHTLRQGPEEVLETSKEEESTDEANTTIPPSRWQLDSIQKAIPWLHSYTLSGIWRLLKRNGLKLRSATVQHYSPDPDYEEKETNLLNCLREMASQPEKIALLFLDEMGYYRWPEATAVWSEESPAQAPVADRQQSKQQQWRLIGALNALTGQVDFLDAYIVGRQKVIEMYTVINQKYDWAERIMVVQDNWSIHKHTDVMDALTTMPRIEPVWLPTYSPWLNPIEKLWRWLRQAVLKMHRLANQWPQLQERVRQFLTQFAAGSDELLHYVGLAGNGKLAQAIQQV